MERFDYAVIGSGPAGYVSAIRAAQLGLKTLLVEKHSALGGTCLNVGCIPSKALLESSEHFEAAEQKFAEHGITLKDLKIDIKQMMSRKEEVVKNLTGGIAMLMKKNKVTVIEGRGRLKGAGKLTVETKDGTEEIEANAICLALGSEPVELPFMKFDHKRIIDSTDALALPKVPKHMVVIGGGAIGLEMGSVWKRLGAKVTVIEMMPQITPFADKQMAKTLQRSLEGQGIEFMLATKVTGAEVQKTQVKVSVEDKSGTPGEVKGDVVLVAVGRKPYTADCGLEEAGVEMERGRVVIDDHFHTNLQGVYAIGDLVRGPMLAHKGEEEGIAVAELLAGQPGHVNYDAIPNVVYTHPELASVGITDDEAKEKGFKTKVGKFLFRGLARIQTMGETDGMVKIVADADTDRILGATIVGPRASEMIAEITLAMEFRASSEDVARTTHAHPTLSEVVKEACLAVDNRPIHG